MRAPSERVSLSIRQRRYASQMAKHAPPHLWAIAKGDRPYCEQMMPSFDWLFVHVQHSCALPACVAGYQDSPAWPVQRLGEAGTGLPIRSRAMGEIHSQRCGGALASAVAVPGH